MANTVDETLLQNQSLAGPWQERLVAQRMREAKNTPEEDQKKEEDSGKEESSLRQRWMAAKKALNLKEKAKKKIQEKAFDPVNRGTNWLLRSAWLSLIPSGGLSLIWINIHVFLRFVFGDRLFSKLGHEWIPPAAKTSVSGRAAGDVVGIGEKLLLFFLDVIVFFVFFAIVTVIVWVIAFISHPVSGSSKLLWDWTKGLFGG